MPSPSLVPIVMMHRAWAPIPDAPDGHRPPTLAAALRGAPGGGPGLHQESVRSSRKMVKADRRTRSRACWSRLLARRVLAVRTIASKNCA